MRHRTPRARGQPEGLPQAEAWAERERVPSGHNCRRQLATGRPEQIQEPGTAVPGTPIFANNAQRGGPPLESPCRWLSLVLSFASKESTIPLGAAAPPPAPESARQTPPRDCLRPSWRILMLAGGSPCTPSGRPAKKRPVESAHHPPVGDSFTTEPLQGMGFPPPSALWALSFSFS